MAPIHPDAAAKSVFRLAAVGQPPTPKRRSPQTRPDGSEAFWLSLPLQRAIDRWMAAQPDPKPSRAEAVRRLLERGLAR